MIDINKSKEQLLKEIELLKATICQLKEFELEHLNVQAALEAEILKHKASAKTLQKSEEMFRKLAETAPAGMFVLESNSFTYVNSTFISMVGYEKGDILNMKFRDFIHPDHRELVLQRGLASQKDDNVAKHYEFKILSKNGEAIWLDYFAAVSEVEGKTIVIGIAYDISKRKQYEEKIKYLSFYDKLTNLYNRAFFEEELKRLDTRRQQPISIIMGDVNGLKLVNDALGHQHGDRLLQKVAKILKSCCREEDIIARWGGDEFVLLLPDTDEKSAINICNRIKETCHKYNYFHIEISIALGHSSKHDADTSLKEILKVAEDRMYRNKLLESQSIRSSFISSLEKTLWSRSHETQEHCHRLRQIALRLGQLIQLDDSEIDDLVLLATLHDIGKIAIPNNILDKPEGLTTEEWESIRKHPEIGYRIALSSPEMAPIADAILAHHEHWDGNGYPLSLKGQDIPKISRIVAIADAYDVMMNGRPYRKAISKEKALTEIQRCAGTQFDPDIAVKFVELISCNAITPLNKQSN
ncbi:MAG: diguanylate cyclase [Syntrophomonadaceae bacterium]|nr:diguanylate cyclase [Syntrophomonadaceae bacterium]